MKIKYDMSKNFYKIFNEAQGIFARRRRIYKYYENGIIIKVQPYSSNLLMSVICIILAWIILGFTYYNYGMENILDTIMFIILICGSLYTVIIYGMFWLTYFNRKNNDNNGEYIFDENGITNNIEIYTVTYKWDKIESIIVGKSVIVCSFTNKRLFIPIDISAKDELINAAKKYIKDIKIIELK